MFTCWQLYTGKEIYVIFESKSHSKHKRVWHAKTWHRTTKKSKENQNATLSSSQNLWNIVKKRGKSTTFLPHNDCVCLYFLYFPYRWRHEQYQQKYSYAFNIKIPNVENTYSFFLLDVASVVNASIYPLLRYSSQQTHMFYKELFTLLLRYVLMASAGSPMIFAR